MAVVLVTYDLKKPGQDYADLLAYLKRHPWAKLSESSYAIETAAAVRQVKDQVRQYVDPNDNVYVITLSRPWTGYGPEAVNEWLRQRLGSPS